MCYTRSTRKCGGIAQDQATLVLGASVLILGCRQNTLSEAKNVVDSQIHALTLPDGIESRLPGHKGTASG
jgi:hypothetical protein